MRPEYDYESPGSPLADDQLIPSEAIEGYIKRFIMIQLEGLAFGLHTPQEVKNNLKGMEYFISCSCGIHARMATSNVVYDFTNLPDDEMIQVARKTFDLKQP